MSEDEGIRINIQRSTKLIKKSYEPEEAIVSITVPAKKVKKELIRALQKIADQCLIEEVNSWCLDKKLAIEELPPEKVKEIEDYVEKMLR